MQMISLVCEKSRDTSSATEPGGGQNEKVAPVVHNGISHYLRKSLRFGAPKKILEISKIFLDKETFCVSLRNSVTKRCLSLQHGGGFFR